MWVGFIEIVVSAFSVPPRRPSICERGVLIWRSFEWYMRQTPGGTRCETTARVTTIPLRL